MSIRVRYKGQEEWQTAELSCTWNWRDRVIQRGHVMSASSGPKDYLVNDIITLFSRTKADQVFMLVLNGTMFLIVRLTDKYYDVANGTKNREVEIDGKL